MAPGAAVRSAAQGRGRREDHADLVWCTEFPNGSDSSSIRSGGRNSPADRPASPRGARSSVDALALDLLLQEHDPVHQAFRPRRAARDVDVHRDDRVDPLHHRVVVEDPAGRGAGAHRDGPLGLRHLVPDPPDDGGQLERQTAGADQHVGLAGRKAHPLHAEPRQVEAARGGSHELDGAAGGPERHGPERIGPRPIGQEVEPGGHPVRRDRRDGRVSNRDWSIPLQRSALPDVDVPDRQNHDEDEHLDDQETRRCR